jgi:hypothetical protein
VSLVLLAVLFSLGDGSELSAWALLRPLVASLGVLAGGVALAVAAPGADSLACRAAAGIRRWAQRANTGIDAYAAVDASRSGILAAVAASRSGVLAVDASRSGVLAVDASRSGVLAVDASRSGVLAVDTGGCNVSHAGGLDGADRGGLDGTDRGGLKDARTCGLDGADRGGLNAPSLKAKPVGTQAADPSGLYSSYPSSLDSSDPSGVKSPQSLDPEAPDPTRANVLLVALAATCGTLAYLATLAGSTPLLGAFATGAAFSRVRGAAGAFHGAAPGAAEWLARVFFGSVGLRMPIGQLFSARGRWLGCCAVVSLNIAGLKSCVSSRGTVWV